MTTGENSSRACEVCSGLSDSEYAYSKFGWPEHDTFLPEAAEKLVIVKDFQPLGSRKLQLRQCPSCGAWFLYRTDYEYLTNGTEDEEFLTRLTEEEAAEYRNKPE
ncbi:hypothetical protein SDC9_44174 [bioreactor metagenome]|jgi:hypothetical protein|uniref:Uncharacterized protein n=2 Tax=root TaxID=1 RepID=A0A4R8M9Z5_9BACT|nr:MULTISPECIES: hypothetical protein [Aminivibrio]MDD3515775.1 hypothetical protein [Synergistaceae bacterium]MEA4952880.1 hypothetical protein [Aminivibrio sp.]TDY60897.1 hypothetical protein C8D99_107104 [Aminivibrio pyruvatiphilus]